MNTKMQQSEEAKSEYAKQLQTTNEMQTLHYASAMPEVFEHLQVCKLKTFQRNVLYNEVLEKKIGVPLVVNNRHHFYFDLTLPSFYLESFGLTSNRMSTMLL